MSGTDLMDFPSLCSGSEAAFRGMREDSNVSAFGALFAFSLLPPELLSGGSPSLLPCLLAQQSLLPALGCPRGTGSL